jgi:chitin disaccharide deacetylase
MLIINADDWGRTVVETDAALACQRLGRVTSVSAMVFMADSARAAELALEYGVDVGLHLNLSQRYTHPPVSSVAEAQDKIVRFMTRSKYALLLYQPTLRRNFSEVYFTQAEEFMRLYGQPPSHVDGHQHRHLCANMLIDSIIPRGMKVRRNFSFWPGDKSLFNRTYRDLIDKWLARRYRLTDFFFSLGQCLQANRLTRVTELAKIANVELMTHPLHDNERAWLLSDAFLEMTQDIQTAPYILL